MAFNYSDRRYTRASIAMAYQEDTWTTDVAQQLSGYTAGASFNVSASAFNALYDGFVAGISIVSQQNSASANTITIEVYKNNIATGYVMTITSSDTPLTGEYTLFTPDTCTFVAGDVLDLRYTFTNDGAALDPGESVICLWACYKNPVTP